MSTRDQVTWRGLTLALSFVGAMAACVLPWHPPSPRMHMQALSESPCSWPLSLGRQGTVNRLGVAVVGLATLVSFWGCGSDSDAGSGPGSKATPCWKSDNGCRCGTDRPVDAVEFSGTCSEGGVGKAGICCQYDDYCQCRTVECSIDSVDGICLCGLTPNSGDVVVESCTDRAKTCCTQDTGYCYCEDGCENRFANRVVPSCDRTTTTVSCSGAPRVVSCQ
jgi:hypothetical protein